MREIDNPKKCRKVFMSWRNFEEWNDDDQFCWAYVLFNDKRSGNMPFGLRRKIWFLVRFPKNLFKYFVDYGIGGTGPNPGIDRDMIETMRIVFESEYWHRSIRPFVEKRINCFPYMVRGPQIVFARANSKTVILNFEYHAKYGTFFEHLNVKGEIIIHIPDDIDV